MVDNIEKLAGNGTPIVSRAPPKLASSINIFAACLNAESETL